MGTGKLNVFVMRPDDSCGVDPRTWLVSIFECDGQPLKWCDRAYIGLPARCGHVEIDVPPGCYSVVASWRPEIWPPRPIVDPPIGPPINPPIGPIPPIVLPAIFTDHSAVTVCCDGTACVQLFVPSARRRARLLEADLRTIAQLPEADRPAGDVLDRVGRALTDLLGSLPQAAHPLELAELERR